MPRVPVLDQQRVRTSAFQAPAIRSTGPSGMERVGATLQQAGGAVADIATKEAEQANRLRVGQMDLELGKLLNDESYGPNGFLLQEGENALGHEERLERVRQKAAELEARAGNDWQRAAFRERVAARLEDTRVTWTRHADRQRDALFSQIAEGQTALAIENAGRNYADADAVEREITRLLVDPDGSEGVLLRDLRNRGLPAEVVDSTVASVRAKVYATALDGYLQAGDLAGARKWYEAKKDDLGPAAKKYGESIQKAELAQRGSTVAANLIAQARDPETGAVDELAVRTAFSALNEADAETRKAVKDALDPMLANELAAAKAKRQDVRNLARGIYNRGGLNAVRAHVLPDGSNLLDYLNRHDAEYEATLRKDADRKARQGRESQRERNERDRQALAEFRALDPEERLQVDPEDFALQWGASPLGISTLRAEQQKAKQAVERGYVAGERDFVRDAEVQTAGLPDFTATRGGSSAKKVQNRKTSLRSGASLAFQQFIEQHKREPTPEERQRLIDGLISKQVVEERWYGDREQYGFETVLEQQRAGGAAPDAAPAADQPRPPKLDRALQLRQQGRSNAEIAEILTSEGY